MYISSYYIKPKVDKNLPAMDKNGLGYFLTVILLSITVMIPSIADATAGNTTTNAASLNWHDELPHARVLGSGEFRWFGFRIYNAKLWSEHEPFDVNAPFALELSYHRSISRERLVDSSVKEIKRLYGSRVSNEQLQRWQVNMTQAFTDVSEGDELIGVYLPGQGCRFYFYSILQNKQRLQADIHDPAFAQAFFAIWLDARTKDSGLRDQLLGAPK